MYKYIENFQTTIINGNDKHDPCEITTLTIQNVPYEFYSSNSIRKLINFNNY